MVHREDLYSADGGNAMLKGANLRKNNNNNNNNNNKNKNKKQRKGRKPTDVNWLVLSAVRGMLS